MTLWSNYTLSAPLKRLHPFCTFKAITPFLTIYNNCNLCDALKQLHPFCPFKAITAFLTLSNNYTLSDPFQKVHPFWLFQNPSKFQLSKQQNKPPCFRTGVTLWHQPRTMHYFLWKISSAIDFSNKSDFPAKNGSHFKSSLQIANGLI